MTALSARRRRLLARALSGLAALAVLAGPAAAPAAPAAAAPGPAAAAAPAEAAPAAALPAAPRPTPSTPTLPVPRATVDPRVAVGGEQLASMGVVLDKPAAVPPPPRLRDVSWLLADLDTGEVLAARAPHARLLPASTLKTLTALTLIPRIDPHTTVVASPADADADGTRVGLLPGLPYSAHDLFNALLMSSANDAAYALARAAGGSQHTLALMNAEARHLGALDTVAKDPSGLDAPGQTSSAYDLALIGRAALRLPQLRTYVTTKHAAFPGALDPRTHHRRSYAIQNHNRLLYNYPGTIGVKNGYTEAAHRTFISAVQRGGRTYLLTEMYSLETSWRPQAAFYDWAFRYGPQLRPVGRLVAPGTVTTPPTLPPDASPSAPAGAGAGTARVDPPATRAGAAAAIPSEPASAPHLQPWVGVAGLLGAALLVVLLAAWTTARARRRGH